jgi:hypothetical protein
MTFSCFQGKIQRISLQEEVDSRSQRAEVKIKEEKGRRTSHTQV